MARNLPGSSARAFDAIAADFDRRFGSWLSVAAQRRAVRRVIRETVPPGASVLELGGGTGEDARWLVSNGYGVLLTDPSPAMIAVARAKLAGFRATVEQMAGEELDDFAGRHLKCNPAFDVIFSNFAALNCISDLTPVVRGMARFVKPGGCAILVLFGTFSPGEIITEFLRGRPGQSLRRLSRKPVPARVGGHHFAVTYHRGKSLRRAMQPWFRLVRRAGIGVFVPPSAAEPWISNHPRLLNALERIDQLAARPLAVCGDHILYCFKRTSVSAP